MSDHDDFGAFLAGFVVGGVTGAVVALLLAPQSGENTRTMIREKSIELRDKAAQSAEQAIARAEAAAAEARARAEELARQIRGTGKEVIEAVKKPLKKSSGTGSETSTA
jgi:gas vesicle protein